MKRLKQWEKGAGTTIIGVFVMLLATTMCLFLVQTFVISKDAQAAQTAADSIADATAVYASNEGLSYEEAVEQAEKVQQLVEEQTNTITSGLILDKEAYEEDSQVHVNLDLYGRYTNALGFLSNGNKPDTVTDYKINAGAVTEFSGYGNSDIVRVAVSKVDAPYYWGYAGPSMFDCSGLVSWCYWQLGSTTKGRRTTTTIVTDFPSYKVDKTNLQAGDLIICNYGRHVVIYMGDGNIIGASGGGSATTGNNPQARVKIQPLSTYDNAGYVQAYRVPISAW